MRRWPWPRRIRRWCRWSLSATATPTPRLARRTIENAVSKIGTPRITSGMNSGAKKKNVWPENGLVAVAADRDRGGRHEQPEHERAGVTHDDPRRVEVVREEAEAHAQHARGDQRPRVVGADHADVVESLAVQHQRTRGDRHDAGREAVETIDVVDRRRHADDPHDGDQRGQVGRERQQARERDAEEEDADAREREHAPGEHGARELRRR